MGCRLCSRRALQWLGAASTPTGPVKPVPPSGKLRLDELPKPGARSGITPLAYLIPFLAPYRLVVGLAAVFLLSAALLALAVPVGVRQMIDHGFSRDNALLINRYFLLLIVIALALGVATAGRFYCVSWLGERVVADLRRQIFGHLLTLSPSYFEVMPTGDLLSRLSADTTLVQTALSSSLSIALRNVLLLCGGLAMLLLTSPAMTGLVLLAVPVVVMPLVLLGRAVRRRSRAAQERAAESNAWAAETLGGIQAVQAYNQEGFARSRFNAAVDAVFVAGARRARTRALLTALVITLVFSSVVGVLWVGAQSVLDGRMSAGALSQFILYAIMVATGTGALSEVWGELQQAAGAAERLTDLLSVVPSIRAPAHPIPLPVPAKGHIQLQGVDLAYPLRPGVLALDGIDLEVRPGETVALVGPSGAGKTSLFALLLRFFDPTRGIIRLDGVDVAQADPSEVRRRFALVAQDTVIFSGTALDNLKLGRPEASAEEVRAAARAAQADEFILALPQGYASFLGERGVALSGGQRQRIAIARAILRDAPVLLLDEATSALDAQSEHLVAQALGTLMRSRTTLVIAHRLATVQRADRILVLDRGRLVAQGTHAELLAAGGLYATLATLQFGLQAPQQ